MTITYEVGNGLYINVTNQCTNACDFCVRTEKDNYYGDLWLKNEPTKEEILEDVKKRDLSKYDEIVFCGYGEPTMRLHDVIYVAKEIRKFTDLPRRINTNGQANLIYGEDVTPLFKDAFETVSISLNAPSAKQYQAICHSVFGEAAFEGIIDFASKVKHYVKDVVFSVVDESITSEDIEKCKEIADKAGVRLKVRKMIK